MFRKLAFIFLIILLLLNSLNVFANDFEVLMKEEINSDFNTVEGYEKLREINKNARLKYRSKNQQADDFLWGSLRYGIYVFDDLYDNLDPSKSISFVLNTRVDKYMNKNLQDLIKRSRVAEFMEENHYDPMNWEDILVATYRLSFTLGKNHDIVKADNKVLMDEILDESIKSETYPIVCGEMSNISTFNGRTGLGLFPVLYCNYFIDSKDKGIFAEPENFSIQVGNFVSPYDIGSYLYMSLDDLSRLINDKSFLGLGLR